MFIYLHILGDKHPLSMKLQTTLPVPEYRRSRLPEAPDGYSKPRSWDALVAALEGPESVLIAWPDHWEPVTFRKRFLRKNGVEVETQKKYVLEVYSLESFRIRSVARKAKATRRLG